MIELWDSWGPMFVDFSTTGPGPAYLGSAHGIMGFPEKTIVILCSSSTAYGDIFVASKGCMDWLLIHICNVHIYIYVYIYIQLYIYTTIYVCTCTCTYMYVDTYTYTIIHLLRFTHIYIYMCIYIYICIYICNVIPCPYILVYLFTICIMSTPDETTIY